MRSSKRTWTAFSNPSTEPPGVCHLDELMAARRITGAALDEQVGITPVILAVLNNNRAKAVQFTTLTAICQAPGCQPGDVFSVK